MKQNEPEQSKYQGSVKPNFSMIKKIIIIAFIASIACILNESFAFLSFIPQDSAKIFFSIKGFLVA